MTQIQKRLLLALLALVLASTLAYAYSARCQVHPDSGVYKTGNTEIISGQLAWEYYCYRGHYFWAR